MSEYIVSFDGSENLAPALALAVAAAGLNPLHEEIVRCRDCRHFTPKGTHRYADGSTNEDYCEFIRQWMLHAEPDGFCKWGVKRVSE